MFTGIVQSLSTVTQLQPTPAGRKLVIERGGLFGPIQHGDSVCVSGVCLTAVDITGQSLGFDVVHETLSKTSLGDLHEGGRVNLELAVTPNQPLGGHFMQGHVDGLATVDAVHDQDGEWRIALRPGEGYADLMQWIIPRGSIAIDGVSLTLARVSQDTFEVALIPATLEKTTLGALKAGDQVNIEADILAKTVVHQMDRLGADKAKPGVSMDMLRDAGFVG
ncbi:MAG: riboflavin synthase [Planctomycetota bacterium]